MGGEIMTMEKNENYYLPFPTRLRSLLEETGASQREVADFVGVSRQAIAQWKDGQAIPYMYNFKKTADFFKVSYEYLYGDTDRCVKENIENES